MSRDPTNQNYLS